MTTDRKPWTADEIATLRNRYARQWTFDEIATELGRTRNSCIGKAHKLGLERPRCRSTEGMKGWARSQAKRAA